MVAGTGRSVQRGKAHGVGLRPAAWAIMLAFCHGAGANPTGASVAAGAAQFQSAGNTLTVTNTPGTIVNWQQFSIGAGEHTRFQQQSAASSVLNRVVGGDPSGILGTLSSNGRVFLVNPNGIVFGQGAVIDTAGFIASTLNIADRDFLEGRLRFEGGGAGALRNEGAIRAGGDIFLVGPRIENAGLARSDSGSVVLAAGKSVTITGPDAQGLQFALQAPADTVLNLGRIEARNAVGLFAGTLRHSGDIRATGAGVDGAGRVVLSAQADAIVDGNATIAADNAAGRGGSVQILGERVGLLDHAKVSASGTAGGGEILIGGDYQGGNPAVRNAQATYVGPDALIRADATEKGNGGKVIVWADQATRGYGAISARGGAQGGDGGFVETSGAYLDVTRTPDVTAPKGRGGEWLLDPNDITITNLAPYPGGTNVAGSPNFTTTDDGARIHPVTIQNALDAGTSVTITTGSAGSNAAAGNISIQDMVTKTGGGDATLTLTAHNDINIVNSITSTSGRLNMVFNADSDSSGSGAVGLGNGVTLDANGGTIGINGNYLSVWGNPVSVLINNSTVNVAGDFHLGGGAGLDVQNGSTLAVGGKFYFSDGTLRTLNGTGSTTVAGGVYISGSGTKTLGGTHTLTNNGSGEWSGTGGFELSGTFNNAGTLKILKDGQLFNQSGTFNNSGTFWKTTATAGTTEIFDAAFNNSGTLRVASGTVLFDASAIFTTTGTLNVAGGAQLTSANTITLAGGTLLGAGTVNANVNNTGGTVAAGTSPGTLTINGNYSQGAGGTFSVELGGTNPGVGYDLLQIAGTATLDGTLGTSLVGGFAGAAGNAFDVMTYASRSGDFANFSYPAGYTFTATPNAAFYRLVIASLAMVAPSPATNPATNPTTSVPNGVSPNLMLAMLQPLPGTTATGATSRGEERKEQVCRP